MAPKPAAESMLLIPNNMPRLDATTSFAAKPAIRATPICQNPNPAGFKIGTKNFPIAAPKLSDMSSTKPVIPKFKTNQSITDARKIVVPAFDKYSLTFSQT